MSGDLIVGRRGDSILGKVLERAFAIRTAFGRTRVETRRITWIHLKDPPDLRQDEVWMKNGDRLTGALEQRIVRFRTTGGEVLEVPREAIHSVVVGAGFAARARALG